MAETPNPTTLALDHPETGEGACRGTLRALTSRGSAGFYSVKQKQKYSMVKRGLGKAKRNRIPRAGALIAGLVRGLEDFRRGRGGAQREKNVSSARSADLRVLLPGKPVGETLVLRAGGPCRNLLMDLLWYLQAPVRLPIRSTFSKTSSYSVSLSCLDGKQRRQHCNRGPETSVPADVSVTGTPPAPAPRGALPFG